MWGAYACFTIFPHFFYSSPLTPITLLPHDPITPLPSYPLTPSPYYPITPLPYYPIIPLIPIPLTLEDLPLPSPE